MRSCSPSPTPSSTARARRTCIPPTRRRWSRGWRLPGPRPHLLRRLSRARRARALCQRLSQPRRWARRACLEPRLGRGGHQLFLDRRGEIRQAHVDRIIRRNTSLSDAAKCALISFDSTMRSNVSVGPPIDLLIYRRNSLRKDFTIRLEDDDPYLQAIRDGWGGAIHKAFHAPSPNPGWAF